MPTKQKDGYRYSRQAKDTRSRTYRNETRGTVPTAKSSNVYTNTYNNTYSNTYRDTYTGDTYNYINTYRPRQEQNNYYRPRSYTGTTRNVRSGYQIQAAPRKIEVKTAEPRIRVLTPAERAANKKKFKSRVMSIAGIAVVFFMALFMLYRHAAIFGKNQEIESLNSEYNKVMITNEGIQAEIDKSIELGNLESVAKNRLGMVSPDSSQIFYVDMGAKDEVVKSSSSK